MHIFYVTNISKLIKNEYKNCMTQHHLFDDRYQIVVQSVCSEWVTWHLSYRGVGLIIHAYRKWAATIPYLSDSGCSIHRYVLDLWCQQHVSCVVCDHLRLWAFECHIYWHILRTSPVMNHDESFFVDYCDWVLAQLLSLSNKLVKYCLCVWVCLDVTRVEQIATATHWDM